MEELIPQALADYLLCAGHDVGKTEMNKAPCGPWRGSQFCEKVRL